MGQDPVYVIWDGPGDPENPVNWSRPRKWLMSALGFGFVTLVSGSVSGYAISQPSLEKALHVSHSTGTLGVVVFTISVAATPLVLAPFSELYGRLPMYIASSLVFWIMFLPQALAKNFATELVTRFISGVGASTAVALLGGLLADIWETDERGLPMAIFSFVVIAGTGLGPVSLGYVELALGYTFINWILFGLSGLFALALIVVSKESRASVILIKKAARLRAETGDNRYRAKAEEERSSIGKIMAQSLTRPVRLLFTEPILFAYTMWITYSCAPMYLLLEAVSLVFTELHNFNAGEDGLVSMGQIIGPLLGSAVNVWCDRAYTRNVARKGPEARLYIAMYSGLALPIGCWMYTWTSWSVVHWVVPMIGLCLIYSAFVTSLACFNYITDSYTVYASSALSGQSCVRLMVGAIFSVLAAPMYSDLGVHLSGSVLAALSTVFAVTPFLLYRYGAAMRAKSSFAKQLAS
ncbi:major facilitator superfamily domain-containing protein [Gautieria morchelliformis]|nr:major facilitator superfamily domain-containing protein [Gautieria morchelliformis]